MYFGEGGLLIFREGGSGKVSNWLKFGVMEILSDLKSIHFWGRKVSGVSDPTAPATQQPQQPHNPRDPTTPVTL